MSLSLLAALGAGILSFLSPCVLPLMPGYLSYLAGVSLEETKNQPGMRWRVSQQAFWFVLGCALLLTLLGAGAALLGHALSTYQQIVERIGGLLLILFGLVLIRLIQLPWFSADHRIQVRPGRSVWWHSGLIGIAFGASWSACASPLLGAILVLTAVGSHLMQGALVMLVFGVGQGVPLLLVALLVDRADPILRRIRRTTAILSSIGGVLLILMGVFLLTGLFSTTG